jgi:carbonic anhydrase/acetyltransferase-like protein (isoleucine patch superfamily)
VSASDAARTRLGYLTVEETARLGEAGVAVLDPFSTLISPGVTIEPGVTLYPNVILRAAAGGQIAVGGGAELWPGVTMVAAGGRIAIGPHAEIGYEGGFALTAAAERTVAIGERARLTGGGAIQESGAIGMGRRSSAASPSVPAPLRAEATIRNLTRTGAGRS